jgi:hypothetical protein
MSTGDGSMWAWDCRQRIGMNIHKEVLSRVGGKHPNMGIEFRASRMRRPPTPVRSQNETPMISTNTNEIAHLLLGQCLQSDGDEREREKEIE